MEEGLPIILIVFTSYEIINTNEVLIKRAKAQAHLLQQFTRQWLKEYLLSLRETHKINSQTVDLLSQLEVLRC